MIFSLVYIMQGIGSMPGATVLLRCSQGIPSRAVCCPSSCGTCGGPICALLPGGSALAHAGWLPVTNQIRIYERSNKDLQKCKYSVAEEMKGK